MNGGGVLDVRRLRVLHELSLRGTVAAVAAAVHQSPSAVSQQLSQLQREAGVVLLRRVGRGVQLTAQGELLARHAGVVLDALRQAEWELAASLESVTGTVRLAVFQSAALALLPATLSMLAVRHPQLRVTVSQREPESALYATWAREFDLVVAEQYPGHAAPRHPELDRVDLVSDELRLAVPWHGLPWGEVTSLADTARAPWVMEPRGVASRHFAENLCRQAGFEPDVRFETADLQAQIRLVESGNAVAILPDLLWAGREPSVVLRPLEGAPLRTVFTSVREAAAGQPAIVACREALARAASSNEAATSG